MSQPVPDFVGEITAFRSWRVDVSSLLRGPCLTSYNSGAVWPFDDYIYATCRDEGEVPHEISEAIADVNDHRCGIYAARDRSWLMTAWNYHVAEHCYWTNPDEIVALGEVGLSGRVIRGLSAHRAARARPLHLWLPHLHWRLADPLSRAYDIPVEVTNPYRRGRVGNRPSR